MSTYSFSRICYRFFQVLITGYKQSVTGCGSQWSHVVVTQRKLMCDPHIEIEFDFEEKHKHLKWTSLSTTHLLMVISIWGLGSRYFCWVTTTWLLWEPQPVRLCLLPLLNPKFISCIIFTLYCRTYSLHFRPITSFLISVYV